MKFIRLLPFVIYSLYAAVAFSVMFIVAFILFIIIFNTVKKPRAAVLAHKVTNGWSKLFFAAVFIRVKLSGQEKIDPNKLYVMVANHLSQIDIPLYALSNENTIRFLAKHELTKLPGFGYVIKHIYITVNRNDRRDRTRSIEIMRQSINEGVSVFLCPEGTRNRTDKPLLEFRDGAFRLAIEAQVPLAVLTVINTRKLNHPSYQYLLKPGTVRAIWSDPISTTGMTDDDIPALKQKAHDLMMENIRLYAPHEFDMTTPTTA